MAETSISPLEKWQNLFSKYTLPEVRALRKDFEAESQHKKQELRSLIATRYPDLIHIAGEIVKMNVIVSREDETLTRLCTFTVPPPEKQLPWLSFGKKTKNDVEIAATKALLKSLNLMLRQQLNSFCNWTLLARSLILAEMLGGTVEDYRREIELQVSHVVLQGACGKFSDNQSVDANLSALICYMIVYNKDPATLLKDLVRNRCLAVSALLCEPQTDNLLQAFKLCNASLNIVESSYSKNQLHRLVAQQLEKSTLIFSPEILGSDIINIIKYQKWLPEIVTSYPSFPSECIKSIINKGRQTSEDHEFYNTKVTEMSNSFVEILMRATDGVLDNLSSIPDLVDFLRKILEIFHDAPLLGELRDPSNGNLLASTFIKQWIRRGKKIINDEIQKIQSIQFLILEKASSCDGVVTNSSETTGSIFSPLSVFGNSKYSVTDLGAIFDTLDNVVQGKVGSAQTIMNAIDEWTKMVYTYRDSFEGENKLKNIITTSEHYDEAWKSDLEKYIEDAYSALRSEEIEVLSKIESDFILFMLNTIKDLKPSCQLFVLILRIQLYMNKIIESLTVNKKTSKPKSLKTLIDTCYKGLTNEICSRIGKIYINTPTTNTWVDDRPVSPSLDLFGSLTKLVDMTIQELGSDELIFKHNECILVFSKKIAETYLEIIDKECSDIADALTSDVNQGENCVNEEMTIQVEGKNNEEKLNQGNPNISSKLCSRHLQLQIALDKLFVCELFNLETPTLDLKADEILFFKQIAKEYIKKTHLLYYPFAVPMANNSA